MAEVTRSKLDLGASICNSFLPKRLWAEFPAPPEQQGSWNLSFVRGRTNKQTLQLKRLSESRQKWRKHGKAPVLPSFKLFISEFWKVFCLEFLDYPSAKLKIKRFAPRRSWQMPNVGLITLASLFNIIRQTDRLSDIIKIWPLCSIINKVLALNQSLSSKKDIMLQYLLVCLCWIIEK